MSPTAESRREAVERHRDTLETLADLDVEGVADLSKAASEVLADAEDGGSA